MTIGFHLRAVCVSLTLGCAALGTVSKAYPAPAPASSDSGQTQHIVVTLDKAKLVRMPEHVDTVVVGNPIIADVTMLKRNGLVVITGKGYGETNIIFLDSSGQAVSEAAVSVERAQGLVTIQRGLERESYSCLPRCEPAVALGDATRFLSDTTSQITSRNGLAGPSH